MCTTAGTPGTWKLMGGSPIHHVPIFVLAADYFASGTTYPHPILSTSLTAVAASRFRLRAADWDVISGATPQYRITADFGDRGDGSSSPNTSDVVEVEVYDAVGAESVVSGTGTVASPGGGNVITVVRSAWTNVPAGPTYCYVRVRNQTGARGTCLRASLEIRYV